jgi:hypothetical protein
VGKGYAVDGVDGGDQQPDEVIVEARAGRRVVGEQADAFEDGAGDEAELEPVSVEARVERVFEELEDEVVTFLASVPSWKRK